MKMYFIFIFENSLHASSQALTTTRMEFEALEDDVNAIHGDLWEQLNAGGQVCCFPRLSSSSAAFMLSTSSLVNLQSLDDFCCLSI